ncbi:MAG: 4-hydroxy-tetrahydrodipicolinate reductase [Clostridiales bacterium]|jgi:4-hydroxy-tetrahydrodipicolinate reductase|nr:4-hydroxy-tetrahydrodipicolinate reductase [Clostridiales bacterium]MDN5298282.1 4-hydroxy-tetrahydrodipicolinate reductase [Clostridiales bacterium]
MRIILAGANGTMGKHVATLIGDSAEHEIVAGIDQKENLYHTFPYYQHIEDFKGEADCIIDFSHYTVVPSLIAYALTHALPIVVCTTGLSEETEASILEASKQIPIFKSGNMSLGINLLLALVKTSAKMLEDQFDIEIIEKHHHRKIDAPSGTAKMIANSINSVLTNPKRLVYGREGNHAKRQEDEMTIHAIRGGTIVGEHEVIFAGLDEVIEIKHTASSRTVFAKGAITAAGYILGKPHGLYDMDHLIYNL